MLLLSYLSCVAAAAAVVLGNEHPHLRVGRPDLWRRQTTSTYDFWWPYPPATDDGPTTAVAESATVIPILLSTISASAAPSSVLPQSTAVAQALPSSTSTLTSAPSTTISSSDTPLQLPTPTPTPNSDAASTKPNARAILPAIASGIGLMLLFLGVWVLWGVCTRRPRVGRKGKDRCDLIAGPAYCEIGRGDVGDIERALIYKEDGHTRAGAVGWGGDMEEEEGMLHIPKNAGGAGPRWPSYGVAPVFEDRPPKDDEEAKDGGSGRKEDNDELQTLLLVAPGRQLSRTSLERVRSDATSAALHALSAAPSEYGDENPERGVTRPRSLRRALAARIEEERVWTESVRAARARGADGRLPAVFDTENVFADSAGSKERKDKSRDGAKHGGRRRRGHVRADSDVRIGDSLLTSGPNPMNPPLDQPPPIRIPPPPAHTRSPPPPPPMRMRSPPPLTRPSPARGRRSTTRLKDEEEDRYTRRPTRRSESRGGSRSADGSRSPSRSPAVRRARPSSRAKERREVGKAPGSGGVGELGGEGGINGGAVLPQSPPQLMSPELARQMCFTPIPSAGPEPTSTEPTSNVTSANLMSPRSPRAHGGPSTKKDRKRGDKDKDKVKNKGKDKDVPPLPLPDALRGRLRKKRSTPLAGGARAGGGGDADGEGANSGSGADAGAAQRVDDIMAAGWGARGLGQAGIRSLSPTGFGRTPAGR